MQRIHFIPELVEDVLYDVFGLVVVLQDRKGVPVQVLKIEFKDLLESCFIPTFQQLYDRGIGEFHAYRCNGVFTDSCCCQ